MNKRATTKYKRAAAKHRKARAMRQAALSAPTIGGMCRMIAASYRVRMPPLRGKR